MLQETRQFDWPLTQGYNFIQKKRDCQNGGGLVIGVDKQFTLRDLTHLIPNDLNQENQIEMILAQASHAICELYLINLYIPYPKQLKKGALNQLQQWITQLLESKDSLFIISGDLNQKTNLFPQLNQLVDPQQPTLIASRNQKFFKSDWIWSNQQFRWNSKTSFYLEASDHSIIETECMLPFQPKVQQKFLIPFKQGSFNLCFIASKQSNNSLSFIERINKLRKFIKHKKSIRLTIRKRQEQKFTWQHFIQQCESYIRTSKSKHGWKIVQRLSVTHPQKRDGGLMTSFLNDEGKLTVGHENIINNCLSKLTELSGQMCNTQNLKLPLPNLSPLNDEEIKLLQLKINDNKAITLDGYSLQFFRSNNNVNVLNDWWCQDVVNKLGEAIFAARLIPLNKVFPNIPSAGDFRPITVTSPAYKWLENRFSTKIQQYLKERLDRNQTGFIEGCGTGLNIFMLINKIQQMRKKDAVGALFIDFKSAYNTICRDRLFKILQDKDILNLEESQFLRYLQNNLFYQTKSQKVYLRDGVIQGSSLSPGLFNIYMEDVMKTLISQVQSPIWYKVYADDLVIITQIQHLKRVIQQLRQICLEYKLIINNNKSAVLPLKNYQIDSNSIEGIPIVNQYKYLGINIDGNGTIAPHLKFIEQRWKYLQKALYFIRDLTFKNQALMWSTFVKPYFQYSLCIINTQKQNIKKQFFSNWRSSIKKILKLPQSTSNQIIDQIFGDLQILAQNSENSIKYKINLRAGEQIYSVQNQIQNLAGQIDIKLIPENFKNLFYQYGYQCKCCNKNLHFLQVLKHKKVEVNNILNMFKYDESKPKLNNQQIENKVQRNYEFINELLENIKLIR
ncbi:reverse transcriptase (macronuclear) [Tetrahymena thermophila SB210]|uniref:Reverse transcriptase n=1 Tax=Tetrahymena thermophila (strain SB210) TaxID=312017 RepID=I7M7X4_TETTS|nr:reverse transcriptase [Tetrahymena thermophila SB210]EAR96184.2 reverse transcriptase [Tetrahymena thermophila SB210]|eukprot:XP_001016429.2 reverse transcriptase [Tetrahymena thermophila SB210]